MEHIIKSLVKKIGLSSNQLLKCVLLHTSIELFSYIDASAYSSSGYLYHDWGMEDFDHLYCALPDEGKVLESDIQLQSLPSDRIADFNQPPSVVADTSDIITSVDELETMYLPIPENLCVQDRPERKLDSNDLDKLESFYYLVGPMNLWLEFPLAQDTQVTQDPPSAATNSAEDDLLCCFGKEHSFLNGRPELSSKSEKQEVVLNSCGVQTTEEQLLEHTFSESFDHDAEVQESILWDSYDLHLSRSPMEATHVSLDWQLKDYIFSDPEDLFTLLEEEMFLWSEQVDYLWYNDLYFVTGEHAPQQQVASTPFTQRTRKFQGEEDAVKRHEF